MLDLKQRMAGLVLLIASCGSTLVHRRIYGAVQDGPAQVAELAIGLLTFCLASTGILLVIHGSRLFRKMERRTPQPPSPASRDLSTDEKLPEAHGLDSREGVALLLARRVIAAASAGHDASMAKSSAVTPRDAA